MSRFVQGRRTGKPATAGGLSIGFLLLLIAGPMSAQTSPIQGDDIQVSTATTGYYIHPRIIALPDATIVDDAGGQVRASNANGRFGIGYTETLGGVIGAYSRIWTGKTFGLQLIMGSSAQVEDQRIDIAAGPRDGLEAFAQVFAVEKQGIEGGVDSDVALVDGPTGIEITLDFNLGIGSHPDLTASINGNVMSLLLQTTELPSGSAANQEILLQRFGWSTSAPPEPEGELIEVNNSFLATGPSLFSRGSYFQFYFEGLVQERLIVVWESFGSPGNDDSLSSIQARIFELDGTPVGGQFQVNSYINGFQSKPDVAALDDGNIVIVWQSDGSFGNDDSLTSIQARIFDPNGSPQGPEFQVNNEIMGFQYETTVAAQNDGDFVVAWTDQPLSTTNISARQFRAGGVPVADQFQVNQAYPGDSPSIAASGDLFMVVWAGGNIYMNGNYIFFADGFESGDTTAWSDTSS